MSDEAIIEADLRYIEAFLATSQPEFVPAFRGISSFFVQPFPAMIHFLSICFSFLNIRFAGKLDDGS